MHTQVPLRGADASAMMTSYNCVLRIACLTSQDGTILTQSAVCRNGMEPLATLHHFVHPQWFEELGAFEKEENISLFLEWVKVAYE